MNPLVTKADLTLARRQVKEWQPRVHLEDWAIHVLIGEYSDAPISTGAWAYVQSDWVTRDANIALAPNMFERAINHGPTYAKLTRGKILERVVLHELGHISQQPFANEVEKAWRVLVGGATADRLDRAWYVFEEQLTEHFERVCFEAKYGLEGWRKAA